MDLLPSSIPLPKAVEHRVLPHSLPTAAGELCPPSPASPCYLTLCPQDLRQVRFAVTGTEKQVNTQWAVDLIAAVPPKKVHARVVGSSLSLTFLILPPYPYCLLLCLPLANYPLLPAIPTSIAPRWAVTEAAAPWATPRSSSTWTRGSPSPATTAACASRWSRTTRTALL